MTQTLHLAPLAASLAVLAAAIMPEAARAAERPAIVLVHGAWADGSSWSKVIPLLKAKGLKVVAVQLPLSSLAEDAAATGRAIAQQGGPVILVGHSWGGEVITQAGGDAKVAGLVYVAGWAPDTGQSLLQAGAGYPASPGAPTVVPDAAGWLSIPAESFVVNFAQDLPKAEAALLAATQGPVKGSAFGDPVTVVAWKAKPTWYVVAGQDRMIDPGLEAMFAKRMNAKTILLPSSHVAMLSHPVEVANLIVEAADSANK
jgi:pimeloyl-ACP methyl ester carboxylesterase